jgi:outer membrane receptor protein involved in Fe transport
MREGLNGTAAGYFVIDLTVSTSERLSREVLKGFELSASVYNLLDQKYAAIAGPEHVMNLIYQDGISFRVLAGFKY